MTATDLCPKFQTCGAPVCPLDQTPTVHLDGETVCYYLRACVKAGADELFAGDPAYDACKARLPELVIRHPSIGRALAVAAKSGFKGLNLIRPRQRRDAIEATS